MNKFYKEAVAFRRSYYMIERQSHVSDAEIEDMVRQVIKNVPSAFNSQSSRIVLLLGDHHVRLWDITLETLRKVVAPEAFGGTEKKIRTAFSAGYGTALFFEDQRIIKNLQERFPLYADSFPGYSLQTSAMHQITLWTMLEDAGFGASLQHYNPLIDDEVRRTWDLPAEWRLMAQMPFGAPGQDPAPKTFEPIDERMRVFK